jgi:hypothetical protein
MAFDYGDHYLDNPQRIAEIRSWLEVNLHAKLKARGIASKSVLVRYNNLVRKPGPVFNFMMKSAWVDGRTDSSRSSAICTLLSQRILRIHFLLSPSAFLLLLLALSSIQVRTTFTVSTTIRSSMVLGPLSQSRRLRTTSLPTSVLSGQSVTKATRKS